MRTKFKITPVIHYLVGDLASAYADARAMPGVNCTETIKEREGNLLREIRLSIRTPAQIAEDKVTCERLAAEIRAEVKAFTTIGGE